MWRSLLHLTVPTTPPAIGSGASGLLTPLVTRYTQLFTDLWNAAAPFLTLLVALQLVSWWLSWRSRGKSPESDQLTP